MKEPYPPTLLSSFLTMSLPWKNGPMRHSNILRSITFYARVFGCTNLVQYQRHLDSLQPPLCHYNGVVRRARYHAGFLMIALHKKVQVSLLIQQHYYNQIISMLKISAPHRVAERKTPLLFIFKNIYIDPILRKYKGRFEILICLCICT